MTTAVRAADATQPAPFASMLIVGIGLIGASMARAARRAYPEIRIVGLDAVPSNVVAAAHAGIVDAVATDLSAAVADIELVVLAVPVRALPALLERLRAQRERLESGKVVVTDVGSTKASLQAAAEASFGTLPSWLVPGHPLAGSERSGWAAGRAELFVNRRVLLCPTATNQVALLRVQRFWATLGARVEQMPADVHDALLAQTSHLPHMLAYALVDGLIGATEPARLFHYSGGGFRDMTRLAASNAVMWRDVALDNRTALLAALDLYSANLAGLRADIAAGDGAALQARFERAKRARDEHLDASD